MEKIDDIDLPLGIMDDGQLVRNPHPNLSRLVVGGTGSGKTSATVIPTAQALFGMPEVAVSLGDPKQGEGYAQLRGVAQKLGRKLVCVDDFGVFGFDNPDRISLNAFGASQAALQHNPETLNFAIETDTLAFVPEVDDGGRNRVFREMERRELHLGERAVAELKPSLFTPGGVYNVMSDPHTWTLMREVACDDGSPSLKARARSSLELQENSSDQYQRGYVGALLALAPYEVGSVLSQSGSDPDTTHEKLCNEGAFVCFVLPQLHAPRVGVHLALHQQSMLAAQFSGRGGRLHCILDEVTNSPQKRAIEAVTIQRSAGVSCDYVAQTFEDLERQYGKQLAATLADNCAVHQYLSFSDVDAPKVSKLMGEEISIQRSMNINPQRLDVSGSMSMGKQPVMTPDELKNLPPDHQVVFIRGYGWLVCRKLYQNQIGPTCHWLSPNPQERGRRLPPDPKIELPVAWGEA